MLRRKMFRDIRFNLSQFITIFLMVFMGIMVYAGIRSYMDGMVKTADKFYSENNLEDLVAVKSNFTDEDLKKIKEMDNVQNAERRLTLVGTMESEEERTLELNFIESNEISKLYAIDGEGFDKEKRGVWLDNFYAQNNNLHVNGELKEKPAETLRTELPKVKQKSINITTKGIFKKLNFSAKWNIRDIIRNKMRTFMGIAGITGCSLCIWYVRYNEKLY